MFNTQLWSQYLFGSQQQSAIQQNNTKQQSTVFVDRNTDIDWVIVDPCGGGSGTSTSQTDNEETKKLADLKRSLNLARSLNEYGLQSLFDSQANMQFSNSNNNNNNVNSNHNKNNTNRHNSDDCDGSDGGDVTPQSLEETHDDAEPIAVDEEPAVAVRSPKRVDTWLITPLPSLVSLNTSQRSMIDCGPLENLLIEHPSMSVFISVGEDEDQEDDVVVDQQQTQNGASTPMATTQQATPPKSALKKRKNKRKAQINVIKTTVVQALQPTQQLATTTNSTAAAAPLKSQQQRVLCNFNQKSQLKRNNKLQNFVHIHQNNTKQRKYHNLQQPKFTSVY